MPDERFSKNYIKITKNNPEIAKRIQKSLILLTQNPYHPSLKTHKVVTKQNYVARSSWVHANLRIIWEFNKNEIQIIDLLDLGNHGQVY